MFEIKVPDENDSMSQVSLDGEEYLLRMCYNSYGDYWSLGVYDAFSNPIVPMVKVVPYGLYFWYKYTDLPVGKFFVATSKEVIGRDDFKDGYAHIYYLTLSDIEEIKKS